MHHDGSTSSMQDPRSAPTRATGERDPYPADARSGRYINSLHELRVARAEISVTAVTGSSDENVGSEGLDPRANY